MRCYEIGATLRDVDHCMVALHCCCGDARSAVGIFEPERRQAATLTALVAVLYLVAGIGFEPMTFRL